MSLASGTRLGPYEILAPLGAGGMGEVYRARDERLNRDVAVKVLPASFADNADRLRRFEQEARATGMLNHPNILAVFDVGTHQGTPYLVTELLDGQTLREEFPLSRRKALDYARQICTGLAAAHSKGVTHRDLKPENIFVTTDGRVKILDFGLAKVAVDDAVELTRTAGTTPGVALGTVGYMSPEQARGKTADARSDIFSFGVILYEMLSGERAFHRDSAMDTLSAILKEDPPPLADAGLEKIVRRCLEKSPDQRFQSASDLGFAIEALSGLSSSVPAPQPVKPSAAPLRRIALVAALAALCIVAGIAAGIWWKARQSPSTSWNGVQLGGPEISYYPRVSPNGQMIAFAAMVDRNSQLGVMNAATGDWSILTHEQNKGYVNDVSWSRDSSTIYFDRYVDVPHGVFSIPAVGGEERVILEDAGMPEMLPDGSLLLLRLNADRANQMYRFWPESSRLEPLPVEFGSSDANGLQLALRVFPDGTGAAFFGRSLTDHSAPWGYYAIDLATNAVHRLAPELKGSRNSSALSIAADGQSLLLLSQSGDLLQLAEVSRKGKVFSPSILTLTTDPWSVDALPDGTLYADQVNRPLNLIRFSPTGGIPERLASASSPNFSYWTEAPDGRMDSRFAFAARVAGRFRVLAAHAGKSAVPLLQTSEETWRPVVLGGGKEVVFVTGNHEDPSTWNLAVASLSDGRILRRLTATKGVPIATIASSPDGATIYYSAAGSIWSIPTADGQPRKITAGDSVAPDPNGRDLFVVRAGKEANLLLQVPLDGSSEKQIPLPEGVGLTSLAPNAVSRDGRILLSLIVADSWWNEAAILDRASGKVQRVKLTYTADINQVGWSSDGRIIAGALSLQAQMWRFRKDRK